jgi:hypothetical protein
VHVSVADPADRPLDVAIWYPHFSFLAPCLATAAPEICRDAPGFDRTAFHASFNRAVVEFFSRRLPGLSR